MTALNRLCTDYPQDCLKQVSLVATTLVILFPKPYLLVAQWPTMSLLPT